MYNFGRRKIYCDEPEITDQNVMQILWDSLVIHNVNRADIEILHEYYTGNQPILSRIKTIRPEICNKIVESRANEIVSFKAGYLCGEPIQYVSRGQDDSISQSIGALNDMMLLCDKAAKDNEIAEWMYKCGLGVRMVMPNSEYINSEIVPKLENRQTDFSEDEAPFQIYTLDPRNSFVVYYSGLGEPPVMGVKYVIRQDKTVVYSIYTAKAYYEFISANPSGQLTLSKQPVGRPYNFIPIIEYPLNNARLGAFEIVITILDAINTVQSNRLDGIEQFIQSLIVLVNSEIDDTQAKLLREAGLIKLKSFGDNKADIKIIAEQLDQTQTQTLVDYMYQTILNIVGMPNRNGGTSTSDTGSAVIMRDGWEAAEARAKSDELMFKKAEHQLLKNILVIIRNTIGTSLKLSNIEIKFTRRNYENILAKAQVLTSMLASDKIDPALAFTHCGLFSDPEDATKSSAEHYKEVKTELAKTKNSNGGGVVA